MSTTRTEPPSPSGADYLAMQASPEFAELRSRLRRFVFPTTAFFLIWYATYVLLGAFAHDFMATRIWGNINVGLLLGLGQFLTTFLITSIYVQIRQPGTRPARGGSHPQRDALESAVSVLAAGTQTGNPIVNISIFVAFVIITLVIVIRAGRTNTNATEFFTAGHAFSGPQNGIAIAGDYLSAASFLGIAGAIAVYGYDGFLYSIGFLVAWLVALLLVAELLRNTGKFTMADVLSFRLRQRPVRLAAATSTMTVSLFYLLAQMAGAGGLVALLLDINGRFAQSIVIAVVGVLMIVYVLIGGMKGTTWVQIIKAVLLISGAAFMTVLVLAKFGLNFSGSSARPRRWSTGPPPRASLPATCWPRVPGTGTRQPPRSTCCRWDWPWCWAPPAWPHVLMRFYTVPTAKEARRSVVWAISLIGAFYLFTLALGCGAAAIVGPDRILGAPGGQNQPPAAGLRTRRVILLGIISAVAFATILAVVAGLTITASASFAHDVYASVMKSHDVTEDEQVRVSASPPLRSGWRRSPWGSWPTDRTWHSWSRWRSRWRPRRTCRPFFTRCIGAASTPAGHCGACTAG